MSKVLIGTSGWVYKDWAGIFYPGDLPQNKWLEYYSQNFKTVEVNSTFYHQMKPETFAKWRQKVAKDFIFSVKANRFITHIKRLLECGEPLKRLLEQVKDLGNNSGPILFQLPPALKANENRLKSFINKLRTTNGGKASLLRSAEVKTCFEFRDKSWFQDKVFNILRKYNVATVINDSPHFPKVEEITGDFTYIRFHGPSALYSSEYSNRELKVWTSKIKKWLKNKIDVYCYFNNDVGGFAIKNATTLIQMLEA